MELDLSAPKVITFSIAIAIAFDRLNYSLRRYQRPLYHNRVHAPVGGLFGPGRR